MFDQEIEFKIFIVANLGQGSVVHRWRAHAETASSLDVDPTGKVLASASHDGSLRFWDIASRACLHDLSPHQTHRRKWNEVRYLLEYSSAILTAAFCC